ncbi:MAG: endonuclease/exonuclease/phosphatase [Candidatus Hydrogenedentes bacterium]|nr:endonuclease/exonuclease/phosphatase [Candidatus Hydrogenedentota bacterium]
MQCSFARYLQLLSLSLALVWGVVSTDAATLTVGSFNVESGGATLDKTAEALATVEKDEQCDLWGLCEVTDKSWAQQFEVAVEAASGHDFSYVLGTTGRTDLMAIVYRTDRLEPKDEAVELHYINPENKVRSPLVIPFLDKDTGATFYFMVNHLYRSNNNARHTQASQLNEWTRAQLTKDPTVGVIAVGDYNFDYRVSDEGHDKGFDNMISDGVFAWVKPGALIPSQCNKNYKSILDFVFTAGPAQQWKANSTIIPMASDYCSNGDNSDHRPLVAHFEIGESHKDDELIRRIEAMEKSLSELKTIIMQRN